MRTRPQLRRLQRYLLVGVLTAAPLWITWLVFDFVFSQLSKAGAPWVIALARALRSWTPELSDFLLESWFQSLLAVLFTLLVLGALGWIATKVVGQRLIALFEALLQQIPLVAAIYGGVKRFLAVVKEQPAGVERIVLINFPSPEMKAVGFVTRVMTDESTGEQLAVVYVPTSPNPTSGYIEIVPLDKIVPTDWTFDQAMSFVITGGANAPDRVRFYRESVRHRSRQ